jgi:uncharacterized membrane protein
MTRALVVGLGVSYPLLVWAGVRHLDPRALAALLAAALVLRAATLLRGERRAALGRILPPFAAIGVLAAVTAALDDARALLFLPVLVNAALLYGFGRTLWTPPSMVESFARLQVADLSDAEVDYCRTVTAVWCGFFVVNGAVAAGLAWSAPLAVWAAWAGLLSYLLMGALFAAEFVYRQWRFRRYMGSFTDPVFRRLFPPKPLA